MKSRELVRVTYCLAAMTAACAVAFPAAADELKRRGMIGVQVQPNMPAGAAGADAKPGPGVIVAGIVPNSAAQEAGLEAGDRITAINGKDIPEFSAFTPMMRAYYGGDTVEFTVMRAVKDAKDKVEATLTKKLTLRPRPKETSSDFEVIYDHVVAGGKKLRTYVTKPTGDGKHPAVIIATGPFPIPMEFTGQMAEHPFKKAIDGLTKAGYVTVRVDRPGIGDSEGEDPAKTTFKDEVAGYIAAAEKVKTLPFVAGDNVFVFTHGGGSAAAPLIAAAAPVKGVACYAAQVVRPLSVSISDQMKKYWELETVKPEEIEKRSKALAAYLEHCTKPGANPVEVMGQYPELQAAMRNVQQDPRTVLGMQPAYYQEVSGLDLPAAWSKVTCPVVSILGEADYQACQADSELIAKSAKNGQFMTLKGIDHSCFKAEDQEDSYLSGMGGGEFNPLIVETLDGWMKKLSKA